MNLDYTTKGKVQISMYDNINKLLTRLEILRHRPLDTYSVLTRKPKKLPETLAQRVHLLLAKTDVPVQVNKTRHTNCIGFIMYQTPNEDDYKKLIRVIEYIGNTKELTLTTEPGENPSWWADSSYAVHPDMQSHR